jgi:hypothetical protein
MVVRLLPPLLSPTTNSPDSVVIISIIRLYFLVLVAKHPTDQTWYSGPAAYWSAMEVNLAIVCASTPALKPLVVKIMPMFGSRFGTKQSPDSSSKNNGFTRLRAKQSQSTIGDEIRLERKTMGVKEVDAMPRHESWKEIHVTRDFEQRSVNGVRGSEDSRKELYSGFPRAMGRR